jgi:hypothetical protein
VSISYHIAKKFTIEKCRNINKIIIDKRCSATYNSLRINKKEVNNMSEEQKRLIEETVENLKHLDKESLLVVKGSVEVLKARDAMEKDDPEKKAG